MRVADAPVRRLVVLRGVVRADQLAPDVSALCTTALRVLGGVGASAAGEPGGLVALYPLDLAEALEVAVGFPVGPSAPVPDGADEVVLPPGAEASTLHVGPYEELPLAYAALLGHVADLGHEPVAPITETYVSDPAEVPPHELVTRLAVGVS